MSAESPFVLARATVDDVSRMSPNFVRITFSGPELGSIGTPGHTLDQRIKLIFPGSTGRLPDLDDAGDDWYQTWLAVPEDLRGAMRTYSIRDLIIEKASTRLVVDFVLHLDPEFSGPASRWANSARPGHQLLLLGPRRGRMDGGGIEFSPGDARTILLAGDETAAPAIARILEDIDRDVRGVTFIEVPDASDSLPIDVPEGVELRWLPRNGLAHGALLIPTVLGYLGAPAAVSVSDTGTGTGTDDLLWETPTYSGLGEDVSERENHAARYFWIAGESGVVTTVRRHLVKDIGIDRAQVAFMGYWRKGVAMRG